MRLDLKRKARLEETMLVNEGSGGVTKPHGVADSSGDEVDDDDDSSMNKPV